MDGRVESVYTLKLEMLLFVLRSHQQTCELWAEIPPGLISTGGRNREKIQVPCQIELSVVRGEIHGCLIRDKQQGQMLLTGKNAFEQIQQCGLLSWSILPEHVSASQLPIHSQTESSVHERGETWFQRPPPRVVGRIAQETMGAFSGRHRQVLMTLNGYRGIGELSSLLNCPPDHLIDILNELEAKGLITS
jgi:hypothetical protein